MPFKRGQSGNPEGKPPGTKNKINQEIRQRIANFLDENFDKVKEDLEELEPKDRVRFYIELLQFGLPKLKAIELTSDPNSISDEDLNLILKMLRDAK